MAVESYKNNFTNLHECRLSAILYWTWAKVGSTSLKLRAITDKTIQRLETKFDGSTRRNLRHIIFHKGEEPQLQIGEPLAASGNSSDDHESEKHAEQLGQVAVQGYASSGASNVSDLYENSPTYFVTDGHVPDEKSAHDGQNLIPLSRIETCAIFHKLSEGRGVPHSFISAY